MGRHYFHLHLISDSTGETLIATSRAVAAQYQDVSSIEHVYPLVRSRAQLDRAIAEIEAAPGVVLFTMVDQDLSQRLEEACREFGSPCLSVLQPILALFGSYLGATSTPKPGAQHVLNAEYFKRIDALNYTMMHDDGQMLEGYEDADVLLLGVSRTSKTPTSIYLANRGVRTANIPLVPGVPLPPGVEGLRNPLVVGAVGLAGADRPDPTEPAPFPQCRGPGDPLRRPHLGGRGARAVAAPLRSQRLADHRCDAALDRGDGRRHHRSAQGPSLEIHRPSLAWALPGRGFRSCADDGIAAACAYPPYLRPDDRSPERWCVVSGPLSHSSEHDDGA